MVGPTPVGIGSSTSYSGPRMRSSGSGGGGGGDNYDSNSRNNDYNRYPPGRNPGFLEGDLEEVIHLEEGFPIQEEIHHQETISVMDLNPGETQDFPILVFQGGLEIPQDHQGLKGQVGIQEELFMFLILMLDQIHHHFSSCLT